MLSRLDGEGRSYRVEQAFQQELLDLLLAQPYTQKNPVEQGGTYDGVMKNYLENIKSPWWSWWSFWPLRCIFFFPRPLSSALGSGFDPDAVTGVQVDLTRLRPRGAEPSPFA